MESSSSGNPKLYSGTLCVCLSRAWNFIQVWRYVIDGNGCGVKKWKPWGIRVELLRVKL
ncbi:unnamed protein product [Brassica rapa subsp. trilocularis]